MWDEITQPIPNFNGCTVEACEWINAFIPHIIMDMITYPCCDLKLIHVSKRGLRCLTNKIRNNSTLIVVFCIHDSHIHHQIPFNFVTSGMFEKGKRYVSQYAIWVTWRRHHMKTLFALLTLCEENPLVTAYSTYKGLVMWSFFVVSLNNLLKNSRLPVIRVSLFYIFHISPI